MNCLLNVTNLGKAYREYASEWRRVFSWFGGSTGKLQENWVLQNISFSVSSGEAVGIVGQNGAGKSTLLKIITGTLRQTQGTIQVNGQISAILELGMGFNPDFTGRQNVIHAAGLMGFTREKIDEILPEIEDFCEIGEYFDQPVRTYSSGMQMRVAFSIATAARPHILIVDEALSVGDTYFQHKSFNRIREFQKRGTTLLIVSHDKTAIQSICDRAILLEKGQIVKDGAPELVMDYYNAIIAQKESQNIRTQELSSGKVQTISGRGGVRLLSVELLNSQGDIAEFATVGEDVRLRIRAAIETKIPELVMGYMIKDSVGQTVFGTNTWHMNQVLKDLSSGQCVEYNVRFLANLGPGSYSVAVAFHAQESHLMENYEWRDLALVFSVINLGKKQFIGLNWMDPEISTCFLF